MTTRATERRLFVGTYTDSGASEGIYTVAFDEGADRLRTVRASTHAPNPSFVTVRGEALYVAHELEDRSCLAAYRIGGDGALTCLGACSSRLDAGTCFVSVHPSGRCLYGANYASGSLGFCAVLADGRPVTSLPAVRHRGCGPNPVRQDGPHVHSVSFVPGAGLLAAVDLGTDTVTLYRVGATGAVDPTAAEVVHARPGSGPRMLAFHPRLRLAALVNELSCDIVLFRFDEKGFSWKEEARCDLPHGSAGDKALAAHPAFSPDGRRLYASVRGSDRIAAFALDEDGRPHDRFDTPSGGRGPRHFSLSPDGRFLAAANQDSDDVVLFEVDRASGRLREAARLDVPEPSCVAWA